MFKEDTMSQNFQPRTFSIKLWPPSQSTRQAIVDRMVTNLSTENIFSRRFGVLSLEEANEHAKRIEDICFAVANENFEKEPDGDGSSAVQLYAKETSKLIIDVLKREPRCKEDQILTVVYTEITPHETVFDISGGRRAFIDAKEAAELLGPLSKKGNAFKKICFSNLSFGIDAARVAEPILANIKDQLTDVDLSDFIAGRPTEEALEVMKIFSSALEGSLLRSLNLSNNALGEKGVRAFSALFRSQKGLEELYLMNDGISEEAAKAVCELLPATDRLKILHFHNNMTGDIGALSISEILKECPALEDFKCSSTRVGSEGGVALADALRTCTKLRKLDLRDNMFGLDAGIALAKTLELLSDIAEVYVSELNLEDEAAVAIANALKDYAPTLEVIEIAGNDISIKSVPSFVECITQKQNLTKLNMAENGLKDEGAILIAKALEEGHMKLKELDLSSNMIKRAGARSLARAVVSKPQFELLNINGNCISDEGIDEVKEILKGCKKSVDVLGPLDENDAEGEDKSTGSEEEAEAEAEGQDAFSEDDKVETDLDSKFQNLQVNPE